MKALLKHWSILIMAAAFTIATILLTPGCKKKTVTPTPPPPPQQGTAQKPDTSFSGKYSMIYCSDLSQFSAITLQVWYSSSFPNNDSTDFHVRYKVKNPSSTQSYEVKICKGYTYKNMAGTYPFIEEYKDKIIYGFNEMETIILDNGSFDGDTMSLNFYVNDGQMPKSLKCKYLRQ